MFLSTRLPRSRPIRFAAVALVLVTSLACSDEPSNSITGPQLQSVGASVSGQPDVRAALAAQERHNPRLRAIPGVVGTAVGLNPAGKAVVRVFTAHAKVAGIPASLDNVPVSAEVTGMIVARSDPTLRARPAPVGFSVGHYAITAGTIGARVLDAGGAIYILSNNHVLAYSNDAAPNDPVLQPGPFDGGVYPADLIGTLADFEPLNFVDGPNLMDAAIALSSTAEVGNSTPTDDGYGTPSAIIFDDANVDGSFDDIGHALGQAVQKYGRTTKLTKGAITGINGTVTVCYWEFFGICLQAARFVDQLIIDKTGFSAGGDSGSLIVTDDLNKNPLGLLFAGGGSITVANRIDHVLRRFAVTVDGSASGGGGGGGTNTLHVGDLDGTRATQGARKWKASVTIRIHDAAEGAVANATVTGTWTGVAAGTASCTTGTTGSCAVSKTNLQNGTATFTVGNVTRGTLQYDATANHDSDGDSNGTEISLSR
ncbi:MAG TPA: hypothetical protein VE399_06045 [Gemmatimonadales bacterium]|jgi:hypothetical protein|nr:hypothetical protein [Gemmatimonadales bacterium]